MSSAGVIRAIRKARMKRRRLMYLPLAGILRMRRSRFLLVDTLGALLRIGTYTGLVIPGAVHMSPEDLERRSPEIPRDRDVILYCT